MCQTPLGHRRLVAVLVSAANPSQRFRRRASTAFPYNPCFDPETIANPLDPENLLKSSGRGIFLIRNFMDDVQLQRAPEGGMEIRMVKRVQPVAADSDGSAS